MTFTCCICGHEWKPVDPDLVNAIVKSMAVNGNGPWCELCHYLEHARRVADVRRFNFAKFVKQWLPKARAYDKSRAVLRRNEGGKRL